MPLRILIVEDDPDFVELLRRHLRSQWRDAAITALDPAKPGQNPVALSQGDYDLILLDQNLGKVQGIELLRGWRARKVCTPVIMITASEDEALAVTVIKAGASDFISKRRLNNDRLIGAMEEALAVRKEPVAEPSPTGPLPKILGYRVKEMIGRGSAALVYLAVRESDGEEVVLKLVGMRTNEGQNDEVVERCLREFDLLRRLDTPRVVKIYDQQFTDDGLLLVMEHVTGGTLRTIVKQGPMTPGAALGTAREIAAALVDVHAAGIVHRDLKLANVLLRGDGGIALADFGVAKELARASDLTLAGHLLGTPAYVSPEQAEGEPVDARSDLYSLGIMLYQMLTGEAPYRGLTVLAIVAKHIHAALPQLPDDLWLYQAVLDRLLAKKPGDRYPDAQAVVLDLENLRASLE